MAEHTSSHASESLDELRGKITGLTADILRLVNERTAVAQQIGDAKRAEGRTQIRDLAREEQVLDGMVADNEAMGGPMSEAQVRALGGLLMTIASEAQVTGSGLDMGVTREEAFSGERLIGELPPTLDEREI